MTADREMYEQHLRYLREDAPGASRAARLESMAGWARLLSTAAAMDGDASAERWAQAALLCRAVAATERGLVLSDPSGAREWLNLPSWTSLATTHDDRLRRAAHLQALHRAISPLLPSGAASVLNDIAMTEMAGVPA